MPSPKPLPRAVQLFVGAGSTLIGLVAILAIFFHHSDKSASSSASSSPETNAVSHPSAP